MTIAQQLKILEFPFTIFNSKEKPIYYEAANGYWTKREYDDDGNLTSYESSDGVIVKYQSNTEI